MHMRILRILFPFLRLQLEDALTGIYCMFPPSQVYTHTYIYIQYILYVSIYVF